MSQLHLLCDSSVAYGHLEHRTLDAAEFAPKAWGAICDLLGGADRIDTEASSWR